MGIKQLYNDNLRKLPNEYGDVSVMVKPSILTTGKNGSVSTKDGCIQCVKGIALTQSYISAVGLN